VEALVATLEQLVSLPTGQQMSCDEQIGDLGGVGDILGVEPDPPQGLAQSLRIDQPALAGQPNKHFRGEFGGCGHRFTMKVRGEDTSVDAVNPAPATMLRKVSRDDSTHGVTAVREFAS
jgi:hypothetical protein